jgi:hypothetical protein
LTAGARNDTLAPAMSGQTKPLPEATILHFPRRRMRPDMRALAYAGNDRLLDLACLSMSLAEDARHRPPATGTAGDALRPAFLCAGIILGAIDTEEFTLD